MPYRECAAVLGGLQRKYLPENNPGLEALHGWLFSHILEVRGLSPVYVFVSHSAKTRDIHCRKELHTPIPIPSP
eukprot:scaffold559880_cov37-Prasinocladus_malaysianus.AAC.1